MTSFSPQVNGWVKGPSCGEREWLCQLDPAGWVPPNSFTTTRKQFHCPIPCTVYETLNHEYLLTYSMEQSPS